VGQAEAAVLEPTPSFPKTFRCGTGGRPAERSVTVQRPACVLGRAVLGRDLTVFRSGGPVGPIGRRLGRPFAVSLGPQTTNSTKVVRRSCVRTLQFPVIYEIGPPGRTPLWGAGASGPGGARALPRVRSVQPSTAATSLSPKCGPAATMFRGLQVKPALATTPAGNGTSKTSTADKSLSASTADRSAGRRTARTVRRTPDRPTTHPPEPTPRAACATPPVKKNFPQRRLIAYRAQHEWSRSLLVQGVGTILPCQRHIHRPTRLDFFRSK
jgi:hypothetical protein